MPLKCTLKCQQLIPGQWKPSFNQCNNELGPPGAQSIKKSQGRFKGKPTSPCLRDQNNTRFGEDSETWNVIRRPIKAKSEAARHEENRNVCGKRRNEAEGRKAHQCEDGKRNQSRRDTEGVTMKTRKEQRETRKQMSYKEELGGGEDGWGASQCSYQFTAKFSSSEGYTG